MKRYTSLSEFLKDYRKHNDISQIDLAGILDVDVRTVSRWEKGVSLIKPDKERIFAEELFIPYMVIRHLNSETSIPVYYSFDDRVYSFNAIGKQITDTSIYKLDLVADDQDISSPGSESDFDFINKIVEAKGKKPYATVQMIRKSVSLLPDLNLILHDQTGTHAGCLIVLPLKEKVYREIKGRMMPEENISSRDLVDNIIREPFVFFYYVIYADSLNNSFYLLRKLFAHLKKIRNNKSSIFAGFSCTENQVKIIRGLGLKEQFTDNNTKQSEIHLLEGKIEEMDI